MEDPCSSQEESRPEPITLTKFINQISLSTISEANQERGGKRPGMGKGTHILQRHTHTRLKRHLPCDWLSPIHLLSLPPATPLQNKFHSSSLWDYCKCIFTLEHDSQALGKSVRFTLIGVNVRALVLTCAFQAFHIS